MSVEPCLIDANVLVYAMDADAPQHAASRALLEAARDPSATLYVTSQVLCEFYSIVTNARRVPTPRSPADALGAISALLTFLHVLPSRPRGGRVVGLAPAAPRGWWRCIRPTTGGHHAGEQREPNLYLQFSRF
jgi:predicted nucleic acid-binding protein